MRVIEGNGDALDLKGVAVLPVALGSNLIWHEYGVVPNLPLEVLVGADVLAPHLCSLLYLKNNKKRLQNSSMPSVSLIPHRPRGRLAKTAEVRRS